jgi:hypothetical protein
VINAAIAMNTTRSLRELSFLTSFSSKGSIAVLLLYPFNPSHHEALFLINKIMVYKFDCSRKILFKNRKIMHESAGFNESAA